MFHAVIAYILQFLLGTSDLKLEDIVAYTDKPLVSSSRIVICSSGFFDEGVYKTGYTLPDLPLKEFEGVPILFGDNKVVESDGKTIVYADLVASTYFLITRYEEIIRPDIRDKHGRFIGKESLPARAGFIDRPIVDEYGKILRDIIRKAGFDIEEPPQAFSKIYLTHDIDLPWEQFGFLKAVKRVIKIIKNEHCFDIFPFRNLLGDSSRDPLYTFPWLIEQDKKVCRQYGNICVPVYFVACGGSTRPEDSFAYIKTAMCRRMLYTITFSGAKLGLHSSYEAGVHPEIIKKELQMLESIIMRRVTFNRNHFLNSREPQDMEYLYESGITDDFTIGYADISGFRLGTSRAVRWINPLKKELTNLVLHPLTIMDISLWECSYMNLNEKQAKEYSFYLMDQVKNHSGELVLLWHNTTVEDKENNWQRKLYADITGYLAALHDPRLTVNN